MGLSYQSGGWGICFDEKKNRGRISHASVPATTTEGWHKIVQYRGCKNTEHENNIILDGRKTEC
jgi:hypothetical protein